MLQWICRSPEQEDYLSRCGFLTEVEVIRMEDEKRQSEVRAIKGSFGDIEFVDGCCLRFLFIGHYAHLDRRQPREHSRGTRKEPITVLTKQ